MKKHSQYVLRPGTGRTIPQASIQVRPSPSTVLVAGQHVWNGTTPEATVYSDRDGTVVLPQPFLASAAGKVEFYAADGRYDIYVVYETISYVDTDISIFDPQGGTSASTKAPNDARYVVGAGHALLTNEIVIGAFLNHPDQVPTSTGVIDDEFVGDLSNWSNFGTMDLREAIDSHLHLKHTTSSPTFPVGLARNFTEASSYKITAKLELGYSPGVSGGEISGERPIFGFGIRTDQNEILLVGLRAGAQEVSVCQAIYNASSLVSSKTFQGVGNSAYVRLERSGSDYLIHWSQNGRSWVTVQKKARTSLLIGTVAQVVILADPTFATGGNIDCFADFIRYTT